MDADEAPRRTPWWHLDVAGVVAGLLLLALSTGPSLLPRPAIDQGLVAGLAFGCGYMLGCLAHAVVARLARRRLHVGRRAWAMVGFAWVAVCVPVGVWSVGAQGELHLAAGEERPGAADVALALGLACLASIALLALGKGLARAAAALSRRLPGSATVARASAVGIVAAVVLVVVGAAVGGFAWWYQVDYDSYNDSLANGIDEPSGEFRSVGDGAALSWELAGREGRYFLASGPSAFDIKKVTRVPALQPIRIYAGVDEPGGWEAHAAAVVSELERMHAEDRAVVVVAATTGTGWLDKPALDAVEYLHDGNTAIVAMQYTVTESWHSYLFSPGAYRDATSALIDAVGAWHDGLPEDDRPELYLYGLSLGSRAVQDSFADADELRAFGDGAILLGTPYGTEINAELTAARDEGSAYVKPVVDEGVAFRWFMSPEEAVEISGAWELPRVAFMQHGNDSIVWVGPDIVWREPEWLKAGQRSPEVLEEMRWYPIVTGLQSIFDTGQNLGGPDGIGHRYGADALQAWMLVAGDGGHAPEVLDAIAVEVIGDDLPGGSDV